MPCQVDRRGRPKCHITNHPDRPREKFCATCNQRFEEFDGAGFVGILIAILLAFILISVNRIQQIPSQSQEFWDKSSIK